MRKQRHFSLTSLTIALSLPLGNAIATTPFDWSGAYYGGMIGYSVTNKKSDTTYNNDRSTPIQGWSADQFQGNVYNSIDSLHFTAPADFAYDEINTLTRPSWPSQITKDRNHNNMEMTLLAGATTQYDDIVLSGEFKSAFGGFGATSYNTINGLSGTTSGTDAEGTTEPLLFTNHGSVISGITSPISANTITFSATYQQTGLQKNSVKFKNKNSLVGHLGYSFGKTMIYGLTGPVYAKVKAQTQTTINETASGSVVVTGPTTTNFTAQDTYCFSGQKSKHMIGYTIGSGIEWDIKNNFIFRIEAEYYNLGKINVTGSSTQTSATYNVTQTVTGYGISTGIISKF